MVIYSHCPHVDFFSSSKDAIRPICNLRGVPEIAVMANRWLACRVTVGFELDFDLPKRSEARFESETEILHVVPTF